ncbi:tRNA uracil 4-sulfurtransferase ThiI [Thorsellia kenyensis]|uniref:tRNA sulfurtransferase n=1 Tax=Thorsellia kenyensis TaxID=1549888 RepID=A0ABV6CCP9_9GAMM
MKYVIKLFPEIVMKSDSVRRRFSKILTSNIRNILSDYSHNVAVVRTWDYIEVRQKSQTNEIAPLQKDDVLMRLQNIPGIHHILDVKEYTYTDLHDIFLQVLPIYSSFLENKTFCVRVKRRGKHSFSSSEAEKYIGGGLNQSIKSAKVKLKNPDVTVQLEIDDETLRIVNSRHEGLGGFPIGTQDEVLSLLSGGFDSSVASYQLVRRGCKVHYCFFNLGGAAHEIGVKQTAHYLWSTYGKSHHVRFISIDFAPVVEEILTKIDNGIMGVVLKRMMVRAASKITEKYGVSALVTGEAIGQVSSQTLINLRLIDNATDTLILRPLISTDKESIIQIANQIGTADLAKTMPEYCGVISNNPTVCADKSHVLEEEAKFDFSILDKAVISAQNVDIRTLAFDEKVSQQSIEEVSNVRDSEIIIDIRAPDEQEKQPLIIDKAPLISIPFYKLRREFPALDKQKTYLLYCDKGVMSRLQALYLYEEGFINIKVFKKERL